MPRVSKKATFQTRKNLLTRRYLRVFDQKLTGGQLAKLTSLHGGIKFTWHPNLIDKHAAVSVELKHAKDGSKQFDVHMKLCSDSLITEQKLRDVLAHELCHVLSEAITKAYTKGEDSHGGTFQQWAIRLGKAFPYLSIHTGDCSYSDTLKLKCFQCQWVQRLRRLDDVKVNTCARRCAKCGGHVYEV